MTIPNLNCDDFAGHLADLLERDVDERTRAGMEAHALSCAECGPLLADLRRLRVDAANLPELAPREDLWAGIAARIETPVVALGAAGASATMQRWSGGMKQRRRAPMWIGLAAAGLVAITATVTHEMTKRALQPAAPAQVASITPTPSRDTAISKPTATTSQPATEQASAPPIHRSTVPPASASLVANRRTADQTYADEISRLHAVLVQRRPDLDSTTVAVVEHNLQVIDDAIAQCKAALKKDPASRFLMESLNNSMDDKVQLLRTAAVLPARS
ncbi:MAG TPA: hypothetical protein VGM67_04765 [Gemmatimonadaceae bacterium]|jgi:hypothetical protein